MHPKKNFHRLRADVLLNVERLFLCIRHATQSGVQVVNGPEMLSEFLGESEASMQALFIAARAVVPTVLFLDEVDAIAPAREGMATGTSSGGGEASEAATRVLSVLLTELEGTSPADGCVVRAHAIILADRCLNYKPMCAHEGTVACCYAR